VSARIYVEGGGAGELLDTLFRQGWSDFFRAAGLAGRMPRVVRGQGRLRTFDLFVTSVRHARPGELPMLLVDSEEAVAPTHTAWQHLMSRDKWDRPNGATDGQAFLMVQVMETWFLADTALLRNYFGPSLREAHLRAWPALEHVSKADVMNALEGATAGCDKQYSKGKVSFELLAKLTPALVEAAYPHARSLLDRLRTL
jgi:hypothetical protein